MCLLTSAALLGCTAPTVAPPTSTPTRTPVLPTATLTPTATATTTPTATPTLPPGLLLPPTPSPLGQWEQLPADLYYLQEGRIQHWLAEGGVQEELPVAQGQEQAMVIAFRVYGGGRLLVYATDRGELYVMDRGTWVHTLVPTSGKLLGATGAHFALLPDEQHLLYLAWGVAPLELTPDAGSAQSLGEPRVAGSLRLVDITVPKNPEVGVAYCYASDTTGCSGFVVAPDGNRVAMQDAQGIRIAILEPAEEEVAVPLPAGSTIRSLGWAPDSQHLIAIVEHDGAVQLANTLAEASSGQVETTVHAVCESPCEATAIWNEATVWVVHGQTARGCIAEGALAGEASAAWPIREICVVEDRLLDPAYPQLLTGGGLAFLQRGCGGACADPPPGIYALGEDGAITPIALLDPDFAATAQILWSPGAEAFLVVAADGVPRFLGIREGEGFWDLGDALLGAQSVQWGPTSQSPE